jgi:NTP pyrophosphatase (non-canonical NTP hydrolase)
MEKEAPLLNETHRYALDVYTFRMGDDKAAALKPLEEAAEVFAAYQLYDGWSNMGAGDVEAYGWTEESLNNLDAVNLAHLADEIADVIQAACNLAARYDIDVAEAMARCARRNDERGRYDAS